MGKMTPEQCHEAARSAHEMLIQMGVPIDERVTALELVLGMLTFVNITLVGGNASTRNRILGYAAAVILKMSEDARGVMEKST